MARNAKVLLTSILLSTIITASVSSASPTRTTKSVGNIVASYYVSEMLEGFNHREIGELYVCVKLVDTDSKGRIIYVTSSMPDSGQILNFNAPVATTRNGELTFKFKDDGWGNPGKGQLKVTENKARLVLTQTGWPPEGDRNIGRNYGNFHLNKGECEMHME